MLIVNKKVHIMDLPAFRLDMSLHDCSRKKHRVGINLICHIKLWSSLQICSISFKDATTTHFQILSTIAWSN